MIKVRLRRKLEENHGKPTTIRYPKQSGMDIHNMQKKPQLSTTNHQRTKITR